MCALFVGRALLGISQLTASMPEECLQGQSQAVGQAASLAGSEGEFISRDFQVTGSAELHVLVGMRSLFPLCLSAEDLSCGFFHFQRQQWWSPIHLMLL